MFRLTNLIRAAAVAGLAMAAGCSQTRDVFAPAAATANGGIFQRYVAIGNSITAGFQSNGINDSTQRQSFARLLARSMGTQYHYASLRMPGCTPPIANTATGALVGNAPAGTCALRDGASVTDVLNNVAVPGARVLDPTSASTVASNPLTTFILGGKTQVQRALDARPTFVTIWIGNNDVLQPALSGLFQPIVSTQAQFQTGYDQMLTQLTDSMPGLKGVLIGVAKAQLLPLVVAAPQITSGRLSALAGRPVTVDPGCASSTSTVNVVSLVQAIRAGSHPAAVACDKGVFPAPIGDVFVIDAAEQATLTAAIDGYNRYISSTAEARGFAYYDPNILFAAKRGNGEIPPFPNFGSTSATFGALISLDGVHPTAATHVLLANELIRVINARYGTLLPPAVP